MAFKETPQKETFSQADLWKVLLNFKIIMEKFIGKCYENNYGHWFKILSASPAYVEILAIEIYDGRAEVYTTVLRTSVFDSDRKQITQSEFNMKYAEFLKQSEKLFKTKVKKSTVKL